MATFGVLTVIVKAWCSFQVVSGGSGKMEERPCAFRLRRLAQTGCRRDLSSEGLVLLVRRARFLSYVHSVWQARRFRDSLNSERSFCVTGAGHRTLFHPGGWCGTFWTLLAGVGQHERWFWR